MKSVILVASACLGLTTAAQAAVTDVADTGFEVVETVHIATSPAAVYAAAIQPAKWWSSDHTFSGSAANMSMDAKAGGCWCEKLPDGGMISHMTVTMAAPGKTLVLHGGLAPLFDQAVSGALHMDFKAAGAETDLTMTYRVGGYMKGGFAAISKGVDSVLGAQAATLKKIAEAK